MGGTLSRSGDDDFIARRTLGSQECPSLPFWAVINRTSDKMWHGPCFLLHCQEEGHYWEEQQAGRWRSCLPALSLGPQLTLTLAVCLLHLIIFPPRTLQDSPTSSSQSKILTRLLTQSGLSSPSLCHCWWPSFVISEEKAYRFLLLDPVICLQHHST